MRIHKIQTTEAFIAIDLDGAEASSGPVRWAKKILQGGAKDLARSQTYTYAALGMQRGGASAGISAPPDQRAEAITAFIEEMGALVADGTYLPDAAKGVGADELAPLHAADRATPPAWVTSLIAATACPLWSLLTMRSDSMPRPLRSRDSKTSARGSPTG